MKPGTFIKKPVQIQAMLNKGGRKNHDAIMEWVGKQLQRGGGGQLIIPTLEGEMTADKGDYIIKGVKGEFYPCKPDIFEMTYSDGGIGDLSDGYHTFNELYEFRKLFNAAFFNQLLVEPHTPVYWYDVHKSQRHSDGELCFGGGWFIVVAQLPAGQISNHYEMKDWDLFNIPEREKAAEFDGHTSADVVKRLTEFLTKKS
jgi:hypothetical protein